MRMRMRMWMRKRIGMKMTMRQKTKKSCFYCIKMEFQKIINSLEKTSDNKDLPKKGINKKKNYSNNKNIKIEKPIISISINHNSIV